jgi:hypothetical protein
MRLNAHVWVAVRAMSCSGERFEMVCGMGVDMDVVAL